MKFSLLAAVGAAVMLVPAAAGHTSAKPKPLIGIDGPGFTITLTQGGKKVKALKPGTYTIKIEDKSNIHNFHLTGPGVNKKSSVTAVQTVTWKLKLKKGTYKYVCDPHATIMHGSFKVT